MDFAQRIVPEIKRGNVGNPDDEVISRMERQFPREAGPDDTFGSAET